MQHLLHFWNSNAINTFTPTNCVHVDIMCIIEYLTKYCMLAMLSTHYKAAYLCKDTDNGAIWITECMGSMTCWQGAIG